MNSPALSVGSHAPGESMSKLIRTATFPETSGALGALSITSEELGLAIPEDAVDGECPVLVGDTSLTTFFFNTASTRKKQPSRRRTF